MLMRMVHHQSRQQIPTAIMEIIIDTIPMMKSSCLTFKLKTCTLSERGKFYAKDAKITQKTQKLRKRRKIYAKDAKMAQKTQKLQDAKSTQKTLKLRKRR